MPNPVEEAAAKGAGMAAAVAARAKGLTGVFNKLAEQHKEAAVLLKRAASTDDAEKREDLWRTIRRELLSHEKAELNTVYPAFNQDAALSDIPRRHNEQVPELEAAIAAIDNAGYSARNWTSLIEQLSALVQHHAEEEETKFFPRAEEALGKKVTADLEQPFMQDKERVAKSMP